jgi:hypothetical protein
MKLSAISITTFLIVGLTTSYVVFAKDETPAKKGEFSQWVDAKGNISLPENVRTEWVHLGSWGLKDGMHDVYTQPGSVETYQKNGVFADGTVLVKEVRGHQSGAKTTGQAQWAGEMIQWFVMVKDSKNSFPSNPLWGDGWGWALFKPEDTNKQLATNYTADCMACHIPAASTDRVYIEAYSTLRKNY